MMPIRRAQTISFLIERREKKIFMKFESWTSCEKICAVSCLLLSPQNTIDPLDTNGEAESWETEKNHNFTAQNYNLFLFGNVLINKFIREKYEHAHMKFHVTG